MVFENRMEKKGCLRSLEWSSRETKQRKGNCYTIIVFYLPAP